MFTQARKSLRKLPESNEAAGLDLGNTALPSEYTLAQLQHEFLEDDLGKDKPEQFENVLLLSQCLKHNERLIPAESDVSAAGKILSWLSTVILPDATFVANDELPEGDEDGAQMSQSLQAAISMGEAGLDAITNLIQLDTHVALKLENQVLLSLIAFTDKRDVWTSQKSLSKAQAILSRCSEQVRSKEFLVDFLLRETIQPLFSKTKPAAITSTGRKAMPTSAPPRRFETADMDPANKPWKFKDLWAVTVFNWIVDHTEETIVTESWPLFIPPLLTLIDDLKTSIRTRGLETLSSFLPKFSTKLLKQTGLGQVFEEAITPTLTYLPNLTPLKESLQLLGPAYNALYALADAQYSPEDTGLKMKFLDRVMREGVLQAYSHSSEHVQIVELLVKETNILIKKMGIHAVKYLKDILSILSTILSNPFSSAQPTLSRQAIITLQTLILNCWPRMTEPMHRVEIIKVLVLCWNTLEAEQHEEGGTNEMEQGQREREKMKEEIKIAGRLLVASVSCVEEENRKVDIREELTPLMKVDAGVPEIFGLEALPI
ncbi:hypothetical protein BP5796_05521 [Coleophoma crateriformis]|uniref:Uncharacterized protein n=1 Tax=Coleophoma crateriformis TaxID=565419 RepID=A0A3D8S3E2_9HELO|nr:hypothetical protein BP5796_05521 [Coleophoma crateriformis]